MKIHHTIYEEWCASDCLSRREKTELLALSQEDIEERFYRYLDFGTSGMRGIVGMGTNRINRYTVRRATRGLADFLINEANQNADRGVAIAYDSRIDSRSLAEECAKVLAAAGIPVFLFDCLSPVPLLSFTVRRLKCAAGIVITASHNTKEYNGYKVYDQEGCQIIPQVADSVSGYINSIDRIFTIPVADITNPLIQSVDQDIIDQFIASAYEVGFTGFSYPLNIVYTALHGSGGYYVERILRQAGFTISSVEEQAVPDGLFPTVKQPNPEDSEALQLAMDQAADLNADLVIGTDPDCDRIGVAVRHKNKYIAVTGNQMGILITHFTIEMGRRGTLFQSIVSSDLSGTIAREKGMDVQKTLPGFKYIGKRMDEMDEFLLGYEESYGYLLGKHTRDKDAISTALIICQMTAYYLCKGKTLLDVLDELYGQYGYQLDEQDSFLFEGIHGAEKIRQIMAWLRAKGEEAFSPVKERIDYSQKKEDQPMADMIKYKFDNDSWLVIRPSGTEPKIKVYYSIKRKEKSQALQYLDHLREIIHAIMG